MTPNSFSDQGKSLESSVLRQQLQDYLSRPLVIPDIGFESTAPMNNAITAEEEWSRFEQFLKLTQGMDFKDRPVSFDTYRVDNFLRMRETFLKTFGQRTVFFNDVSGSLDEQLLRALKDSGNSDRLFYIYTFSHIPSRDQTLNHMTFRTQEDVIEACLKSFKKAYAVFKEIGRQDRLILDPGFGFSKSYEQNWELLNSFEQVLNGLMCAGIRNPVLVGLSKKSFLRKALKTDSFSESEHLHFKCLVDLMGLAQKIQYPSLLFRVHDPGIVELARNFHL